MIFLEKKNREYGIFLIYTHKDKELANWFIDKLHEISSMQYKIIRDVEELKAGVDFVKTLENFYKDSYAAIALLTTTIFKKCKSWVFYEIGFFKGQGKYIIPYIPTDNPYISKDYLPPLSKLPNFLSQFQIALSIKDVVKGLDNLNPIAKFLKKVKDFDINPEFIDLDHYLTFQIKIPKVNGIPVKDFNIGIQIIRFGHPDWIKSDEIQYNKELKRLQITFNIFQNGNNIEEVTYDIPDWFKISNSFPIDETSEFTTYKVSFPIPIHKNYGVTFKVFLDISKFVFLNKQEFKEKLKSLNEEIIEEVSISISRFYNSRIYILFKEISPIKIVKEITDNIRNNFIYPQ